MLLLKIIATVLFLSLQGCYIGVEPGYDGQGGVGGYEPPPIVFDGPPDVIVLPDTNYVYVVPDIAVDLFFWNGWWWRPWEGVWYYSRYYDRGWGYYHRVPSFYFDVDPGWRGYYRGHNWYGHRWNYERIPHQRLQQNWQSWNNNRYWERQRTWGVQNYKPRPQPQRQELRRQRQQQYQQRPEVQRQQQKRPQVQQPQRPEVQQPQRPEVQQPQRPEVQRQQRPQIQQPQRPEVQQPQGERQKQPQVKQPRREQESQEESQQQPPQGKPEGRDAEHRR
jgi:hypothetical protein